MTQRGLSWQELLDSIARRLREPDLFLAGSSSESQTPYYDPDEAERALYRMSLLKLRQLPIEELDAVGPVALQTVTAANGATIPLKAYAVAGASIQSTNGDSFVPAEFVSPATYFQMTSVGVDVSAIYTFYGGQYQFKGYRLKIVLRIEPALISFQTDDVVLPAEYNEAQIEGAVKLLYAQDFEPAGRIT